jgi:hypothetical protein
MSLDSFLEGWDREYNRKTQQIALFQPELTSNWSEKQKHLFASVFYHIRGRFHDFLWYVGSHADDKETKDIILKNIAEEFNGSARSHEQLYIDFASSVGADVKNFLVDDKYYMQFAKRFNENHLKWLNEHNPDYQFAALSAYERLDNIDYTLLHILAKSLNVSNRGQIFFKVHSVVEHFGPTYNKLVDIWEESRSIVEESFAFIGDNQLEMWKNLSEIIFNDNPNSR